MDVLREQYKLVSERRSALLEYCTTIRSQHFTQEVPAFANKSIAGLLVHIVDLYWYWVGSFAGLIQGRKVESVKDANAIRIEFAKVDKLMEDFFDRHGPIDPISGIVPGRDLHLRVTAMELVTHVVTHEFHHKGQVLSISRLLGYTPVDTDVIRF